MLTIALLWWSICTALTAMVAASSLANLVGIIGALMLVRFCLGMGEAVALPAFNRAVTNWFPANARGFGIGIAIGGIGLGSAMTPPIAAWVMVNWGWQTVFYLGYGNQSAYSVDTDDLEKAGWQWFSKVSYAWQR